MPPRTQLLRSPGCRRGGTPSGRDVIGLIARLVVEKKIQVAPAFLEVLFALLARLLERAHGGALTRPGQLPKGLPKLPKGFGS